MDLLRRTICSGLAKAGWPEPVWFETTPEDPGRGIASRAVKEGAELVFACGGDGTVMACVTALAGTEVPLGVLPGGTGNLLASNLGIPTDLHGAVETALRGARRRIDVAAATLEGPGEPRRGAPEHQPGPEEPGTGAPEHQPGPGSGEPGGDRFVIMGGMGFDAAMLRDASPALKARIGPLAYVVSGARNLRRRTCRWRLELDGRAPLERRGQGVLVGNLGRLQLGLAVLPDARPDDGELHVAVLRTRSLRDWLRLALRVLTGRHRGDQELETFRARRVRVRCDRPQPVELDGEHRGETTELTVEVVPDALTVCVPPARTGAAAQPGPD